MKPLQILVITPSADEREALVKRVGALGHHARAVASGQEALAVFEAGCDHLLLMDENLPGEMDLLALVVKIREREFACESCSSLAHLVVMVGGFDPELFRQGFAAGINDFLQKPVSPKHLSGLLHRVDVCRPRPRATLTYQSEPLLDTDRFTSLGDGPESPDFLLALVHEFLASVPPLLHQFNQSVLDHDRSSTRLLCRKLQGACQSFGARRVTHLCVEIEEAMQKNASPKGLLLLLNEEFTRMVSRLHHLRHEGISDL